MAISAVSTKEALAVKYSEIAPYMALHTADPGTGVTSEATGGGYARKAISWTAGSSDGVVNAADVVFDVAAGTYTHVTIVSASTAGTQVDKQALSPSAVFLVAGQLTINNLKFTQS